MSRRAQPTAPAPGIAAFYATVTQVSGPLMVQQNGANTAIPASSRGDTLTVGQRVLCIVMPDRRVVVLGPEVRP